MPPLHQAIVATRSDGRSDGRPYDLADVEIEHTTANGVAVRVYVPRSTPATVGLVWVHGGGFTQGGLDVPHAHLVAAQLARRTPAVRAAVRGSWARRRSGYAAVVREFVAVVSRVMRRCRPGSLQWNGGECCRCGR